MPVVTHGLAMVARRPSSARLVTRDLVHPSRGALLASALASRPTARASHRRQRFAFIQLHQGVEEF